MSLYPVSRSIIRGDIRRNTLGSVRNAHVITTVEPSLGPGPSRAVTGSNKRGVENIVDFPVIGKLELHDH
jgi:hypothetical protein